MGFIPEIENEITVATTNQLFFSSIPFALVFAEDAEEKAKKEAEENSQQGTDEKKTEENEGKKPAEESIATKSANSKEAKSGESKSTEANKRNVNGTHQAGVSRQEASQGKNVVRVEKEKETNPTAGDQKRHAQNGKSRH